MKTYRKFDEPNGKPVFIDPMEIEVRPGVKVRDLSTPLECAQAIEELETGIARVASQIAQVEAGTMKVASGWRGRADGAKRWKKRAMKAIRVHAAILGRVTSKDSEPVKIERRQLLLAVILDDIGEDAMDRYIALAHKRYPHAFAPVDNGDSGEKL